MIQSTSDTSHPFLVHALSHEVGLARNHRRNANFLSPKSPMTNKLQSAKYEADDVNIEGSTFHNVRLQSAVFNDVNLKNATFENVAFDGATVRDACLANVSIEDADYTGMTIDGVLVTDLLEAYRSSKSS